MKQQGYTFQEDTTLDGDHGRIETRRHVLTSDIEWLQGKEKWAAFKKLPSMPWLVAVTIHANEVLAPARKLGQVNLIVTLISVLIAALIIYIIANSVSRPINHVVDGLKDAAEGEGDIAEAAADQRIGQILFDPGNGFNKINSIVIMLLHSRTNCQYIRIKNDILRFETNLPD